MVGSQLQNRVAIALVKKEWKSTDDKCTGPAFDKGRKRRIELARAANYLPGTERTLRGAAIQIAAAETTQQPTARRNPSR